MEYIMKICFIYPDIEGVEQYGYRRFYHGIGYLSSYLKMAGYKTYLIYLDKELEKSIFIKKIEEISPDLVVFSATTNQFPFVNKYASWIKEIGNIPIVVGGSHSTLSPKSVLKDKNIDYVCIGEGEVPLLELANAIKENSDKTNIKNIWLKNNEEIIENPLRPLITDLDTIPFADRELFGFKEIVSHTGGWVDIMASRGCPYSCSYCCNHMFKKIYKGLGKYVRFRSVSNVLDEIKELTKKYDAKVLNFQDDSFTLNHKWTKEFCGAYKKEFDIPFWVNTRVDVINEEIIKDLVNAGCKGIRVGIESGNEELRKKILKRDMTNEEIRRFFSFTKKYGLETYTCNMIGIPGETPDMIDETIQLNREIAPNFLQFSVFHPYPMTELYDLCINDGYYNGKDTLPTYYDKRSILKLPTITQEEIADSYDRFYVLKFELALKYRYGRVGDIYKILLRLYGGDNVSLTKHLNSIVTIKKRLQGRDVARYKGLKQL